MWVRLPLALTEHSTAQPSVCYVGPSLFALTERSTPHPSVGVRLILTHRGGGAGKGIDALPNASVNAYGANPYGRPIPSALLDHELRSPAAQ